MTWDGDMSVDAFKNLEAPEHPELSKPEVAA